eukprot:CAMPEP_0115502608 /NCGR_PEP_ID=MMETSP0271-20121206/69036_1 /TAXON_ID=71861 /ORGANISM="Scrippsiella trochoidea, Strain CCMP3099" /LENGTH=46 /DNA_ID= /DNA_START= /DNA_END= /DNA_ORIENTATION=
MKCLLILTDVAWTERPAILIRKAAIIFVEDAMRDESLTILIALEIV